MHGLMGPPDPAPSRPLMVTDAGLPPFASVGLRALLWAYAVVFALVLSALQTINT